MNSLNAAVDRSLTLQSLIDSAWDEIEVPREPTAVAATRLCALALDHGRAVRTLLPEVPPSAIALLRSQFEAVIRAVWARHAAGESELSRLLTPLTLESQQAAKKLPGVADMLAALDVSGPRGAAALLGRVRVRLWDGLNSYVHGGIHPFQRGESGYPAQLLSDLLKNSNGLNMLTLLVLAELTAESKVLGLMSALHDEFADVLPDLEPLLS